MEEALESVYKLQLHEEQQVDAGQALITFFGIIYFGQTKRIRTSIIDTGKGLKTLNPASTGLIFFSFRHFFMGISLSTKSGP